MLRYLFLIHRYLGIAVSLLMVTWCLSGFVMIYVSYPRLDESKRVAALPLLDLASGDEVSGTRAIAPDTRISAVKVERVGTDLIAEIQTGARRAVMDLKSGSRAAIDMATAAATAHQFARYAHLPFQYRSAVSLNVDQWTASDEFRGDRPLYKFSWSDADRTELYVSSATGEAVQLTTFKVRFWNWLGAVPHWAYFTGLRRHAVAWTQFMVISSLLGCFLAAIGIYIGIRQFLYRPSGRFSPYRGFLLWHHVPGLIFGLFALTWVLSGFVSMNPWGLFEGGRAGAETEALRGAPLSWDEVQDDLRQISLRPELTGMVSLRSVTLNGKPVFVASYPDGRRVRIDAEGSPAPLTAQDVAFEASVLAGSSQSAVELLSDADKYYFSHHSEPAVFPVYRVQVRDKDGTRYYLDPTTGEILKKTDSASRGYRWMYAALHRLDFGSAIRGRPVWDLAMLLLLTGVSLVCATGLYGAIPSVSK